MDRRLVKILPLLLVLPLLVGWPSVNIGMGSSAGGGGGGGGSSCTSPDNFLSSPAAAHLYFWQDGSWAVSGDPDDEASGTDQALETSSGLTEAGDLSSADLPAGTPGSHVAVDMDGSTETAYTAANTVGFIVGSDFGDYTVCEWVKLSELDAGTDHLTFWSYGQADDGWLGFLTDGTVTANSPGASALTTSSGAVSTGGWRHVCVVGDGAGLGDATRRIYVDGTQVATDVAATLNLYYNGTVTDNQGINAVHASLNHQFAIWHSALTTTQIQELGCCGINGEADPSQREGIIGGAGGSTCSGF